MKSYTNFEMLELVVERATGKKSGYEARLLKHRLRKALDPLWMKAPMREDEITTLLQELGRKDGMVHARAMIDIIMIENQIPTDDVDGLLAALKQRN